MEMWPFLFYGSCLFWHFQTLTGVCIKELESNMTAKMETVIKYGEWKFDFTVRDDENQAEKEENMIKTILLHFKKGQTNFLQSCSVSMILIYALHS